MSALAMLLDQYDALDDRVIDDQLAIDPAARCRFCRCTEAEPCAIAVVEDREGTMRLARTEAEADQVLACSWFLPGVCNSPTCIEKLLVECRNLPVIFDAQGNLYGRRAG